MDKPTVFVSYSHKDEAWKDRLRPFLGALVQADRIVLWDDRQIDGGDQWYDEIQQALARASVAVCLVSQHFLAPTSASRRRRSPSSSSASRRVGWSCSLCSCGPARGNSSIG